MPTKPRFITLREQHHFDPVTLADRADVYPKAVYDMLMRNPITRYEAEKVIRALSELANISYSLDAIDIILKD